jgi:glycosyltransferase involved in cell wall biosynthesis
MTNKTLSVIMPNYNYGHYIGKMLESVLNQSFPAKEVVVLDDASTDNSVSVVQGFLKKYPNLRLIQNERNLGPILSLQRLLSVVSGDYLFPCASDDWILPGFFEKSMSLLTKFPQAGLCCTDCTLFDGSKYVKNKKYLSSKATYLPPDEVLKHFQREHITPFSIHTAILNRNMLLSAGGYREELEWAMDLFAYSVLSFRHGICYVPDILTVIRIHEGQYGVSMAQKTNLERRVIEKVINASSEPAYKDVLSMFQKTAAFSVHPWEVLYVVINNSQYWSYLSFKLIYFGLLDKFVKRIIMKVIPEMFIRKMLRLLRKFKLLVRGDD